MFFYFILLFLFYYLTKHFLSYDRRLCCFCVSSHEMEERTIDGDIFLPLNASVMEEIFLGA